MTQYNDNNGWQDLIQLLSAMEDKRSIEKILQVLFTHDERNDMAKRVQIIHGLLQGDKTQRQLAQELNVSIAKITRGSNALKSVDDEVKVLLNKAIL